MIAPELQRLWKLAEIDRMIVEIRQRAAKLDVGQAIQKQIDALQEEESRVGGNARELHREQVDLELIQKADDAKIKKIDSDLYSGKVVNPREVEAHQKEIAALKRKRDKESERLLELYDLVPPAQKAAAEVQAKIDERKAALAERRKSAVAEKAKLEEAFKSVSAKRKTAAEGLSPNLLARYEAIRQNHGGIAMVTVDPKTHNCGGCGTHQPERTINALLEGKVLTCEACHRILFFE